jgi:hypothetical protein
MTKDAVAVQQGDGTILATYRYLRMILLLPPTFLVLATLFEAATRGQFRESISDSYQGAVRDVFVGTLMATGVCMIAYKSRSKLEDYALNFAGFNAFFVALVPNNFTSVLNAAPASAPPGSDVITRDQVLTNLRFVLVAFLISALLFTYFDYKLMHWSSLKWGKDETAFASALAFVSWGAEIIFLVVVVGGFVVGGRETLFGASIFGILHFTAAGLLIGNLSFAVASHAFPVMLRSPQMKAAAPETSAAALTAYRVVVAAMWLGLIIGGISIYLQLPYSVIVTEYAEIGLFVAYWLIATRRDWANPMQSAAAGYQGR